MINTIKLFFFIVPCAGILFSGLSSTSANPYLVIEAKSGNILSAHREHDRWYPASLVKLMTAYVTMKAISEGKITTDSLISISNKARQMPPSRMGYKTGVRLSIGTALKILIVKSANDVTLALAESISGNVRNFVVQMNKTAKLLGMTATHFVNPTGLHSPDQFTSAHDMAILSRWILLDFPQYFPLFSIPAIRTKARAHYSYNLLLERFKGANGMKTGFICASGYNMVASAKRNKRQLIAIILGEKSQTDRAVLAARLLEKNFLQGTLPQGTLPIGNIMTRVTHKGKAPENMRYSLCTNEARKKRYDPAAGKAVINSPYLSKRKITRLPVWVSTTKGNSLQLPVDTSLPIPAMRSQEQGL